MNEIRGDGGDGMGEAPEPMIAEPMIQDMLTDADAGSPALERFLTEMRELRDAPAPAPSAELDAYLGEPRTVAVLDSRRRRHARRVALVGAAAACTVTLTGVAAAADVLPGPAQRMVSRVVNDTTGLHIGDTGPDKATHPTGPAGVLPATTTHGDEPPTSGSRPGGGEDTGGTTPGGEDTPVGGVPAPGGSDGTEPGDGYPASSPTRAPTTSQREPGDGGIEGSAGPSASTTRSPSSSPTSPHETESDH